MERDDFLIKVLFMFTQDFRVRVFGRERLETEVTFVLESQFENATRGLDGVCMDLF